MSDTLIHPSIESFIAGHRRRLGKGPFALVFVEDPVEIASTLTHLVARGFAGVLALLPDGIAPPPDVAGPVHFIRHPVHAEGAVPAAVNRMIAAAPGTWFHYCFNAEYLFHPFSETRNVREMLAFHAEERRPAMLTFVVDIYARDLVAAPLGVSLEDAHVDSSGYYALARIDPHSGQPLERQLDFFGGMRWRFEEYIPPASRRIDRIALFRAERGVELRDDHTFTEPEYNTYSCPWHHNLIAAIASFRTAKALRTNPGSRHEVTDFMWRNSVPFRWNSRQLMELGLMETGQWF